MTSKEQVKPKSTSFIALGVYLLGTVASAWAEPDALFAEATRRLAQDRPVYAFTVVTRGRKEVLVETFDPSLEIDAQW
ncbi:MAG: hypothetical protein O7F73_03585 [Gammaproteobacteria bacterium]|nr:hypothetical protein [Gammaproteobacteria bacterium]